MGKVTFNEVQIIYSRPKSDQLPRIRVSEDAYTLFKACYPANRIDHKEFFYVAFLNQKNDVLAISKIAEGGLTSCLVDQREIFQMALKLNAVCIILSHNHPTGNLKPSESDKRLTKAFCESGKILNIQILDHLILTSQDYLSFADEGLMF